MSPSTNRRFDRVIRIGLVGYGRWGTNVARDMSSIRGVRLEAVADVDGEAQKRVKLKYGFTAVVSDMEDCLHMVDAVAVCTPPKEHYRLTLEALSKGLHVMVEKPFALNAEQATELRDLAESKSRVLLVGHQMLYHGAFNAVRRFVASQQTGTIKEIVATRRGAVDLCTEPDVLLAYGPHDISMILALTGLDPISVGARGSVQRSTGVLVKTEIFLEFQGGLKATVVSDCTTSKKVRDFNLTCERCEISFDGASAGGVATVRAGDKKRVLASGNDFEPPLLAECSHFAKCVSSDERPETGGGLGVRVTSILDEARAVMRITGETIRVPLPQSL